MKTLVLLFTTAIGLLFLCFGCNVSRFKDFDVASNNFDPNVFPLNPKWGKQVEQSATPDPHVSCPIYSDNEDAHEWTSSPQYPNCTSYVVTFNGAVPCGAHVNFMPVTYEGKVFFVEHRPPVLDDEYTFNVARDDQSLYDSVSSAVHIEFDSDETVDNWDDTHTWWDNFHHNGVDVDKPHAQAMIDGSFVKVIGLLGLDANHDGKAELHPVYAMFVRLQGNDTRQSSWAFFVRNWGNEGFCGDNEQYLYTRQNTVKVQIPNVVGITADNISDGAQNEDNLSPMSVSAQPDGDGIRLTFTLLAPEKQSWFVGDLTFTARPPTTTADGGGDVSRAAGAIQNAPNDDDNDPTTAALQKQIDKLSEDSKKELYAQMRDVVPRKKSFPIKPVILTEPVKAEEARHKYVRVAAESGLIQPKKDAAIKLNREKKIDLTKKYLHEKGVE